MYLDKIIPYDENDRRLTFITLNEKAMHSFLGLISNQVSVSGLYLALILTFGGIIRGMVNNVGQKVIYEELPNTHDLFDLCESIYAFRMKRQPKKEEKYYDLLIRIYRSPELLQRLTGNSVYVIENRAEENSEFYRI